MLRIKSWFNEDDDLDSSSEDSESDTEDEDDDLSCLQHILDMEESSPITRSLKIDCHCFMLTSVALALAIEETTKV